MRVVIDARAYFQRTGIARYTRELLHACVLLNTAHDVLLLISDRHRPDEVPLAGDWVDVRVSRAPWLGGDAERDQLQREVTAWGGECFHSLFPPIALADTRSVVTVLDITPITHPHLHQPVVVERCRGVRRAVTDAAQVVVPSRATAEAVSHLVPGAVDRVTVIPCGVTPGLDRAPSPAAHGGGGSRDSQRCSRDVLYVGTLEPRKNVPRLCQAVRLLQRRGAAVALTLVGKPGWGGVSGNYLVAGLADARYLGYLPDADLAVEYHRHAVFGYLSEAEGFGLPVLEAMASGLLPVVSRDPALRELVDDPDLSVDERDPEAVADAIAYWHDHPTARARKCASLARRARGFTWTRAAAATLRVYEDAA